MSTDTSATKLHETGIAPWLSVPNAVEAVAFYEAAFGATMLYRLDDDDGHPMVVELAIHGATIWVQEDPASSPAALGGGAVRMILTVDDPDPVFEQAIAAGATVVAPVNEEHGWRIGRLVDAAGHHWEVGRRLT